MSSLAALQTELVGFFSYSRQDDLDSDDTLSALRDRIQRELRGQLGRSPSNFRLWQDKQAIAPGTLWESVIETGVGQSVFFIPIVTPTAVDSPQCQHEFNSFLSREAALERNDLIFPILYIRIPELEDEQQWRNHPVLRIIGMRQYVDWRPLRHLDVSSSEVRIEIAHFCEQIVKALRKPWVPPEERKRREEEAARQHAEEERRAREAEEQRRAEEAREAQEAARRRTEEARQSEEAQQQRRVEQERRAQEVQAQRAADERRRQEADAERRAKQEALKAQRSAASDARAETRAEPLAEPTSRPLEESQAATAQTAALAWWRFGVPILAMVAAALMIFQPFGLSVWFIVVAVSTFAGATSSLLQFQIVQRFSQRKWDLFFFALLAVFYVLFSFFSLFVLFDVLNLYSFTLWNSSVVIGLTAAAIMRLLVGFRATVPHQRLLWGSAGIAVICIVLLLALGGAYGFLFVGIDLFCYAVCALLVATTDSKSAGAG